MIPKDNPAGRLYHILSKAAKNNNGTVREVWASVFEIDPADTEAILRQIADIIKLIKHTKERIQRLENLNTALYLSPFNQIEKAFKTVHIDANWSSTNSAFSSSAMTALQFCADTLSSLNGEKMIEQEEIANLTREVDSLFEQTLESNLPGELKHVIVNSLNRIKTSITDYRIWGSMSLQKALAQSIGDSFIRIDLIRDNKEKSVVKSFFDILSKLQRIVTFGSSAKELIGPSIAGLLEKFQ